MTRSITDAFWSDGFYLKEGDKKKIYLPTLVQQGILERLTLKDILFRAGSIAALYMDRLQLYKSNWKWPWPMHSDDVRASINDLAEGLSLSKDDAVVMECVSFTFSFRILINNAL